MQVNPDGSREWVGISEEELHLYAELADDVTRNGPYDPYDPTFCIYHQQEDRDIEFNWLTVTIDEIITRCGYTESERDRLTESHRRGAQDFFKYYRGPIEGPIPLLEDSTQTTTA